MTPAQPQACLLRLRTRRRPSNYDRMVIEALWKEFRRQIAMEADRYQHESTPLFEGSSISLRRWTLRLRCEVHVAAERVRRLLQSHDFMGLLVQEFDSRLRDMTPPSWRARVEGAPSEAIIHTQGLAPPIWEAIIADIVHFGVQGLVHGERDYLRSVKKVLRSWRKQATLSPRAKRILRPLLAALFTQRQTPVCGDYRYGWAWL